MKKLFQICIALCLLLSTVTGQAQQMVARPFSFMDQLYSNEIFDVLPSGDGLLWVGTTQGLAVWDGYRLRNLRNNYQHPQLLSDNNIRLMAETQQTVWITTTGGVTLYDKAQGRFRQMTDERIAGKNISGITASGADEVWLAVGHRLYRCSGAGEIQEEVNPFAKTGIQEEDFIYLTTDNKQNLWILCRHKVMLCREQKTKRFRLMPPLPSKVSAFTLYQDREDRYWVGTWGDGLWQMFPDKTTQEECYRQHVIRNAITGQEERIVFNMVQDGHQGLLWALTYSGLYALNYVNGQLQTVDLSDVLDSHRMYTMLRRDHAGNVWIGAYDQGCTIFFDNSGIQSDHLPQLKERLGWDVNLLNLYADERYVWMNQDRLGVLLYDREHKAFAAMESVAGETAVLRQARQPSHVWTGSRTHPIIMNLSHDGLNVRKERQTDLRQQIGNVGRLVDLAEDRNANLWILTTTGLLVRPAGKEMLLTNRQAADSVTAIALDRSGDRLWCAAGTAIMHCACSYDAINITEKCRFQRLTPDEEVTHLAQDSNGRLWIATSAGRVLRSDSLHQQIQQPSVDSLLTNEPILDMAITKDRLWLMTASRIICHNTQNGTTRLFPAAQGSVGVKRFLQHALCADGSNGMLAGGLGGMVHLPATQVDSIEVAVRVSDVNVDGQSLFFGTENNGQTFRQIVLPADAHNITVHFSLVPLRLTDTPLQYRLKGVDTDWRTANAAHPEAFYNRLPQGTHQMEVRTARHDGSWGKPTVLMTIVRQPYLWETWWAFVFYASLFVGFTALLLWQNRRRHQQELHVEVAQTKMNMLTTDHTLLGQLVAIIDRNLSDSDFGLDQLATEMSMSKSTLHRRLKAAADMTPLDFIRSIRMKRASEMLHEGKKNVSEVAYSVGFTTPKYFTRCFKEEFGMTPTEYIRQASTTPN